MCTSELWYTHFEEKFGEPLAMHIPWPNYKWAVKFCSYHLVHVLLARSSIKVWSVLTFGSAISHIMFMSQLMHVWGENINIHVIIITCTYVYVTMTIMV